MENKKAFDDHRFADTADKVYSVFTVLVPVLVFVGLVLVAVLVDEQINTLIVVCAGLLVALLSALSYAMAILSKLVSKVFRRMEEADFFDAAWDEGLHQNSTQVQASVTSVWVERAHTLGDVTHDATCPSCELEINMTDMQCPRCRASFLEGSPWAPIPKSK